MNFFEKTIIKIIAKKDKSLGKVDGKTDISKINEENIKVFAKSLYVQLLKWIRAENKKKIKRLKLEFSLNLEEVHKNVKCLKFILQN